MQAASPQPQPDTRTSEIERWLEAIRSAGRTIEPNGNDWKAQCPAHEDKNPSLTLSEGDGGKVLVTCWAGCTFDEIRLSLDLGKPASDVAVSTRTQSGRGSRPRKPQPLPTVGQKWGDSSVAGVWVYFDERGEPAQASLRLEPKSFRHMTPMDGLWVFKARAKDRPIYRLPDILNSTGQVVIVEGEGTADHVVSTWPFMNVTCWIGGSKAWQKTDFSPLSGKTVKLIADADSPGRKAMIGIANRLHQSGADVHVALPEGESGDDVKDWIDRHGPAKAAELVKTLMSPFVPDEPKAKGGSRAGAGRPANCGYIAEVHDSDASPSEVEEYVAASVSDTVACIDDQIRVVDADGFWLNIGTDSATARHVMAKNNWCHTCRSRNGAELGAAIRLKGNVAADPVNVFLVDGAPLVFYGDRDERRVARRKLRHDDYATIKPTFDVGGEVEVEEPLFVSVMRDEWGLEECCIEWYRRMLARAMCAELGNDSIVMIVGAKGTGKTTLSKLNAKTFKELHVDIGATTWDKYSTSRFVNMAVARVDESDRLPAALVSELRKLVNNIGSVRPMHSEGVDIRFNGLVECYGTSAPINLDASNGDDRRWKFLLSAAKPRIDGDPAWGERMVTSVQVRRWHAWISDADPFTVQPCSHIKDNTVKQFDVSDPWRAFVAENIGVADTTISLREVATVYAEQRKIKTPSSSHHRKIETALTDAGYQVDKIGSRKYVAKAEIVPFV